jgi:hypothetical protein
VIWLMRTLAKLPLVLHLAVFTVSVVSLFLWELQRAAPVPVGHPLARWGQPITRTAIVATALTIILMLARFGHVAGVF